MSLSFTAESEGFEPPVRRNAYTAFRVRHFRPLSQLSSRFSSKAGAKVQQIFDIRKRLRIFFAGSVYFALILSNPEPKTPPTSAIETKALGSIS